MNLLYKHETRERETRLNFIVLLRAVAVCLVLLHHYFGGTIKGVLRPFRAFIESGNAGVLIFFLISGFVIALSFEKQKPLEFIVRRFLRVWPILIVATLLSMALGISQWNFVEISRHLSLFLDTMPYGYNTFYLPIWTLEIELKFYILCAVLVYFTKEIRLKQIVYFAIFGIIISFYCMDWLTRHGDTWFHPQTTIRAAFVTRQLVEANIGVWKFSIIYGYWKFVCYTVFMFIGSLFYMHYMGKISNSVLLTGIILLSTCTMFPYFEDRYVFYKDYIVVISCFALLYFNSDKIKISKATQFIANVSYPVYLTHIPIIIFANKLLYNNITAASPNLWLPIVCLIFTFALSYILHIFLEKPIITFSKNLFKTKAVC